MKRLIHIACLGAFLAAGCGTLDVQEEKDPIVDPAAPIASEVENSELMLEEEFDRPRIRYYEIADT